MKLPDVCFLHPGEATGLVSSFGQASLLFLLAGNLMHAALHLSVSASAVVHPLDAVTITGIDGSTVRLRDGAGQVYWQAPASREATFIAGGALGQQTVEALDAQGRVIASLHFTLDAESSIDDRGGRFHSLFQIAAKTMRSEHREGVGEIIWRGHCFHYFEPWILDHSHTMKGMQYLSAVGAEMVDLSAAAQKENGMIWSFAVPDEGPAHGYHYWAYKDQGYAKVDGGVLFARQPVENHNESNFVDALYLAWKANGNDLWMTSHLDAARKALDYSVTAPARWSKRFSLLKRGYTIDSWDFQPDDKYLVRFPLGERQQIDPQRTKFTIFFGDNTAYAYACEQLAEMLQRASRAAEAAVYRKRAGEIRSRLDALTWNGRFFAHHVEEDPEAARGLGVDEKEQFAMSNAYSLNRGIREEQIASIIETYQELKQKLPPRSPGEWYAVYPPYASGFGGDNERWQYMNAGVQVHAAGELARGALEHGFESYGADILARVRDLGAAHDNKLYFAYTGAWDTAPPDPEYTTVDLAAYTNADSPAPAGRQRFAGVPFDVKGAIAVDRKSVASVEIPLHRQAAAVYLLHTVYGSSASNVSGAIRFEYEDGSARGIYLYRDKQIAGASWVKLNSDAGVAWSAPNDFHCVSWAAIANPEPTKAIARLVVVASEEGARYILAALTLGSRMPHHAAGPISFGGPDNWSAALVMYAMLEGLAGVRDLATAYSDVEVSPRWTAAGVEEVAATARYAASNGYVSYRFQHDRARRAVSFAATGSAAHARLRILLPVDARDVSETLVDGAARPYVQEHVRESSYATLAVPLNRPVLIEVRYR